MKKIMTFTMINFDERVIITNPVNVVAEMDYIEEGKDLTLENIKELFIHNQLSPDEGENVRLVIESIFTLLTLPGQENQYNQIKDWFDSPTTHGVVLHMLIIHNGDQSRIECAQSGTDRYMELEDVDFSEHKNLENILISRYGAITGAVAGLLFAYGRMYGTYDMFKQEQNNKR